MAAKRDEASCWCLAATRRRMSAPAPPMSTVGHHHHWPRGYWPWDLDTSHQWPQEPTWQLGRRLIRLHIRLNNKSTFIRILPQLRSHRTQGEGWQLSDIGTCEHGGFCWRIRVGTISKFEQLPPSNSPYSLTLCSQTWRFAFELQHHYGQKSSDSKVKLSESFIILILSAVKRQKLFSPSTINPRRFVWELSFMQEVLCQCQRQASVSYGPIRLWIKHLNAVIHQN